MRVCLVGAGYPPDKTGGGATILMNLKRYLEKEGAEVTVVVPHYGKANVKENGIVQLPVHFGKAFYSEYLFYLTWLIQVWNYLRKHKFDICHGQQLWGYIACFAGNGNWVLTPQNMIAVEKEWLESFPHKLHYWILRKAFKKAKAVIAPTKVLEKNILEYCSFCKRKTTVINTGVDTDYFRIEKGAFQRTKKKNTILYLGRLDKSKGLDDIIRAYQILKKKRKNAKMVVVGGTWVKNYLSGLRKRYKDIEFTGEVYEETREFYSRASVFVIYPKKKNAEACTLTVLEAMACGLPIVCTDAENFREETKNSAFFVEEKNPEVLAEKLNEVLNKKDLEKVGQKMRNISLEYSMEKIAKRHMDLYSKILGRVGN